MGWVECPNCRHKFFKYKQGSSNENWIEIEIKCSSCKKITNILIGANKICSIGEVQPNEN